jgi:hypothetical protein
MYIKVIGYLIFIHHLFCSKHLIEPGILVLMVSQVICLTLLIINHRSNGHFVFSF